MRTLLVICLLATAAHANTTVFMEKNGRDDIPRFGGGDRTWRAIVTCVQKQYAPFAVDITDVKPAKGAFITAIVGGLASQRELDDETTNGVGPYDGTVLRNAVVNVFSQVGTGEQDVENLCAVTAHEVGHALGLDHEVLCGDIMSYYLDQCGARRFIDKQARCGEEEERDCGNQERTQSSYQRLVAMVGLRKRPVEPMSEPEPELDADEPQETAPVETGWTPAAEQDPEAQQPAQDEQVQEPACDEQPVVALRQHPHRHRSHRGHHWHDTQRQQR